MKRFKQKKYKYKKQSNQKKSDKHSNFIATQSHSQNTTPVSPHTLSSPAKKHQSTRVAIVHDFLFQFGGAEKVVERLLSLYPDADLYTSFAIEEKFASSPAFSRHFAKKKVYTSIVQPLFNIRHKGSCVFQSLQKHLFFVYPLAMRMMHVKQYDLVIISSTDCAKHITLSHNTRVIHYCHSPTRYLNNMVPETDRKTVPLLLRVLIPLFIMWLRPLEHNAIKRLNKAGTNWVANSEYIQRMIWETYHTKSLVVYPPIDTHTFQAITRRYNPDDEFYLSFGRISFHKRIDIAVSSCLQLKKRLIVGGTSALAQDMNALQRIVDEYRAQTGDTTEYISFLGRISDEHYHELLSKAKAFLFPGKEDFGITPIECLSAGVPIIAYKAGGALEYVKDGINGIFFDTQSVTSCTEAILRFEQASLSEKTIRQSVEAFDSSHFDRYMTQF